MTAVARSDIEAAAERISGLVRRTPVMEVEAADTRVLLKLELLQHTGSFKPRGAFNRVLVESALPDAGLVAASGGNHGLAVAHVARRLDLAAEVFVAEVTPGVKRDRIAALGATVHVAGPLYQDALEASRERVAQTGAVEIHAYDHPATVAGQGTMARELTDQVPDVDRVVMAVGGGGFAAGAAAWFGDDDVELVAVEPERSAALHAALSAGRPVEADVGGRASDSLGARSIGAVPWEVFRRRPPTSVLVSEAAIERAQRWCWNHLRLVVEPGGATALAAVLEGLVGRRRESLAVVVCGANADPNTVL